MRVMTVYDVHGWAYHRNCLGLQKYLGWDLISHSSFCNNWESIYSDYDMILSWVPAFTADLPIKDKHVCMISSHSYAIRDDWKRLYKSCAGVLSISEELRRALLDNGCGSTCVWQGVDTDTFYPRAKSGNEYTVGWCGSARPEKGHKMLVDVMPRLGGVKFKIIHGKPDMILTADEMRTYYSECDLFLCTSTREGGPLTILEAMACGVPFVSTTVGCTKEAAASGGGRIANDIDGIVNAIRGHMELNNSDKQAMSTAARLAAVNIWSWKKISANYEGAICGKSAS